MSFMTDNLLLNQLKTGENASVELLYKHHFSIHIFLHPEEYG